MAPNRFQACCIRLNQEVENTMILRPKSECTFSRRFSYRFHIEGRIAIL